MLTQILLIRHAQSLGNVDHTVYRAHPDHAIPLSEEGRRQAFAAGEYLSNWARYQPEEKSVLWTSPYQRTRDTTVEIAKSLRVPIQENILLVEQQFGLFDGLTAEETSRAFPEMSAHYEKNSLFEGKLWPRMPMGESRFDVALRIHSIFSDMERAERAGVRRLYIVAHGTWIRLFVMLWCNHPYEWIAREPNPNNASVRLLSTEDGDGSLVRGSDKGHLFLGFP